jgi:two-component system cell cycle response regulator
MDEARLLDQDHPDDHPRMSAYQPAEATGPLPLDPDTDSLEIEPQESGRTQVFDTTTRVRAARGQQPELAEADIILISHPENQRLGSRYRLSPGATIEIGRSPHVALSLPEVLSLSRKHARLRYAGSEVTLEDLGSTNGTYINGKPVYGRTVLKTGDRFQTAAVHYKFLHEQDVESAYHLAIYDLVARDGLTEVYNKRKYEEEIQREFARSTRYNRPLSLIVFDLDDFKRINDNYGHLCGDFILKQIASTIREMIRAEEIIARVGGDEFVIIVPETGLEGARLLAQKLRERIENLDHRYGDLKIAATCSFGVAERTAETSTPQSLYHAADHALLNAKRDGRNQVAASAE